MSKNKKLTAKQRKEKIEAAERRGQQEKLRREAADKTKKIFTVVICIILVVALAIPTVAIVAMMG